MIDRTYSVSASQRGPLLELMLESLRRAGCTIINSAPPNQAPFRFAFETKTGERIGVVAYAFYANSKVTKNRPADEWRFQMKYGSKDGELHKLWTDSYGLYTTLLVGVNPETGIFVGADPEIHNPTKLFISVEFKEEHVERVRRDGWHVWERERRTSSSEPIEVLVGCDGARFLDYVLFERAAAGLDQGHRHLLAERWLNRTALPTKRAAASTRVPPTQDVHALAREFEMSERDVLDLIASARRLKMAVRGWVAEEHLVGALQGVDGVTDCTRSDAEGGPDVTLRYGGSRLLTIQCKNVLRHTLADGTPRLDLQKTRASKSDPCSRFYRVDEYDLVAACLHAITERWEFSYALPRVLDPHKTCPGRMSNNVRIDHRWLRSADAALRAAAGGDVRRG